MFINVLVVDSNSAFAAMIQQVLEETRRFKVTAVATAAEAVRAVSRAPFDLAILESKIADAPLPQVVAALRDRRPMLAVMVILSFGEQSLADADSLDVQGVLSKPFYIPDLEGLVDEALTRPVGGVTPAARPKPIPVPAVSAQKPQGAARRAAPPPPPWLNDVGRAAQYLTSLTLESSAEAALLMRGRDVIAYAGQFASEQRDELSHIVAENWAKDSGGWQGAQINFIRLGSGADYLVYSTLAAAGVVLSLVFQAETPLSMIRRQAKKATEALLNPSSVEVAQRRSAPLNAEAGGDARPVPRSIAEAVRTDRGRPDDESAADDLDEWLPHDRRPSPAAKVSSSLQPTPFPEARRTPHGLYALSYTFLFIPRLPQNRLSGDLKSRLEEWMSFLALAHDWRMTSLAVAADYVEISVDCAPSEAPEKVVKALMQTTGDKIMAEFPRLAEQHAKRGGSFWAPGYYIVAPGRRLLPDEIRRFIEYERREQGLVNG